MSKDNIFEGHLEVGVMRKNKFYGYTTSLLQWLRRFGVDTNTVIKQVIHESMSKENITHFVTQ